LGEIGSNAKLAKESKLSRDIEMVDAQLPMFGNVGITGNFLFPVTR
jgi:hypothetical protein